MDAANTQRTTRVAGPDRPSSGCASRNAWHRTLADERLIASRKNTCVLASATPSRRLVGTRKTTLPPYTAEYLVDYETRLVLGFSVAAAATDVGTLIPMIDKVQAVVGGTIRRSVPMPPMPPCWSYRTANRDRLS